MRTKVIATIALLFILCFASVARISAQTRTAGVREGDHFTYSITSYWSSNNQSQVVPPDLIQFNNTKYYNLTISNISGSNITTDDTWSYINGTEKSAVVVHDLISGESHYMNGMIKITGAGLGKNDVLYPTSPDFLRFNQTFSKSYSNGDRATNILMFAYPIEEPTSNKNGTIAYTFLFDEDTGMLVEERDETDVFGEYSAIVLELVETNVWEISGVTTSSSGLSTIILFIIITVIVVLVLVFLAFTYSKLYSNSKKRRRK